MGGLEVELKHEVRRAVTELYELAVQVCRAFAESIRIQQLQDALRFLPGRVVAGGSAYSCKLDGLVEADQQRKGELPSKNLQRCLGSCRTDS